MDELVAAKWVLRCQQVTECRSTCLSLVPFRLYRISDTILTVAYVVTKETLRSASDPISQSFATSKSS